MENTLYSLLNIEVLRNWYLHARRRFSKIRVKFAPAGTVRQANRLPPTYRLCSLSTLPKRHLTYKSHKCVNQLLLIIFKIMTNLVGLGSLYSSPLAKWVPNRWKSSVKITQPWSNSEIFQIFRKIKFGLKCAKFNSEQLFPAPFWKILNFFWENWTLRFSFTVP